MQCIKSIKDLDNKIQTGIINDYTINKLSTYTIGEKYNYAPSTIYKFLKLKNVKIRDIVDRHLWYSIDNTFFNKIDTEEKAYFLGFLYADGYLNEERKAVTLQLHKDDILILKKLSQLLKTDRPLLFVNASKYNEKTGKNNSDAYRLCISNQKIFNALIKLGLFQRKSLLLKFPTQRQVPNHLIHHFIRGYFDGDGCLVGCFTKRSNRTHFQGDVRILSTIEFTNKLCELSQKIGISTNISKRFDNGINNYNYQLSGNLNIVKFLDWIYKDATIYLDRKYDKMIEFVNIIGKGKNHKSLRYIKNSSFLNGLLLPNDKRKYPKHS